MCFFSAALVFKNHEINIESDDNADIQHLMIWVPKGIGGKISDCFNAKVAWLGNCPFGQPCI